MTTLERLDRLVDRGADKLRDLAQEAAASDGPLSQVAEPLAEDAAFLRRLKPSLIAARIRGEAPRSGPPAPPEPVTVPGNEPKAHDGGGGPNPFVVIGVALALGIFLAKLVDWRGHAHPRD